MGSIQSHKPYVIIDGHVCDRRNDNGWINYKKSVDINLSLTQSAAETTDAIYANWLTLSCFLFNAHSLLNEIPLCNCFATWATFDCFYHENLA